MHLHAYAYPCAHVNLPVRHRVGRVENFMACFQMIHTDFEWPLPICKCSGLFHVVCAVRVFSDLADAFDQEKRKE